MNADDYGTYRLGGRASYFRDLMRASLPGYDDTAESRRVRRGTGAPRLVEDRRQRRIRGGAPRG